MMRICTLIGRMAGIALATCCGYYLLELHQFDLGRATHA